MRVKNYKIFLERLGVPEGNLESAEIITDYIQSVIEKNDKKLEYNEKDNIWTLKSKIDKKISISDIIIDNLNLEINIYIRPNEEISLISAAFRSVIKSDNIHQVYDLGGRSSLILNFVTMDKSTDEELSIDVIKYLKSNRTEILSVISHELKHLYDKHKVSKVLSKELSEYKTYSEMRFGLSPVDSFLFLLYFISNIENSVRPVELASILKSENITQEEFKKFLEDNKLYQMLNDFSKWSFEDMKLNLLELSDEIRYRLSEEGMIDITTDDEELIDNFLEMIYNNITHYKLENLIGLLNPSPMDFIFNPDKIENLNNYMYSINKKYKLKNYEEFFVSCEKLFKFECVKMKRKLSKLYDMCPTTDKLNIHSKINQKSIINPVAYDKYQAKIVPLIPIKERIYNFRSFKNL